MAEKTRCLDFLGTRLANVSRAGCLLLSHCALADIARAGCRYLRDGQLVRGAAVPKPLLLRAFPAQRLPRPHGRMLCRYAPASSLQIGFIRLPFAYPPDLRRSGSVDGLHQRQVLGPAVPHGPHRHLRHQRRPHRPPLRPRHPPLRCKPCSHQSTGTTTIRAAIADTLGSGCCLQWAEASAAMGARWIAVEVACL